MAPHWKCGSRQRVAGSNPALSATSGRASDYTIEAWVDGPGVVYRPITGDHEILPGVEVVATPGHSPGHQSLLATTDEGPTILAGQACYTAAEWAGDSTLLGGRSAAPDVDAYDRSIRRLRDLRSVRVRFGHDRASWTA